MLQNWLKKKLLRIIFTNTIVRYQSAMFKKLDTLIEHFILLSLSLFYCCSLIYKIRVRSVIGI